jgi:hypothetical protein
MVISENKENIAEPPLELLGACNTISRLEVLGCRQGQVIIKNGLAEG